MLFCPSMRKFRILYNTTGCAEINLSKTFASNIGIQKTNVEVFDWGSKVFPAMLSCPESFQEPLLPSLPHGSLCLCYSKTKCTRFLLLSPCPEWSEEFTFCKIGWSLRIRMIGWRYCCLPVGLGQCPKNSRLSPTLAKVA